MNPHKTRRSKAKISALILTVWALGACTSSTPNPATSSLSTTTSKQTTTVASPSTADSTTPSMSTAPSPSTTTTSTPAAFNHLPLWPFTGPADVARWQRDYRATRAEAWHLDPAATALRFTRDHLGYSEISKITSRQIQANDAWIGVGGVNETGKNSTAAIIHLARYGSGGSAPWEVVGTRDSMLTLTSPRYGASVTSPVQVGGQITGVDEALQVIILKSSSSRPIGRAGPLAAGGQKTPWSSPVTFSAGRGQVLTIAVSTGGHLARVEGFAVTGVRVAG
jgi:hypothetical protein